MINSSNWTSIQADFEFLGLKAMIADLELVITKVLPLTNIIPRLQCFLLTLLA